VNAVYDVSQLRVSAGKKTILSVDDLRLYPRELVTIAGANGAGKSTLLSVLSGLRRQFNGSCRYLGRDIREWPRLEFARRVTFITQSHPVPFPFKVEEVVLMGRTPHANGWFESSEDLDAVDEALERTGSSMLRGRDFRTLSGGEQQRVILAAALAQHTEVLLLDEPSSFLDLHHQIQLYKLLRQLRDSGALIVMITHDLNLAMAHADRLLLLRDGALVADGEAERVMTTEVIRNVFGIETELQRDSGGIWMRYGV
jgi:iron complex transport system ATP-binding protein